MDKLKQKISGKAGCFHLILLLIIIILGISAYYWYSQRTYGQKDISKIQNLANQICSHKLPENFKPFSGGDFIIFRYAVFNYEENGIEKARLFLLGTSFDNSMKNLLYKKLSSQLSRKKVRLKESTSMLSGRCYKTNIIKRFENILSFPNSNQTAISFEAWFTHSRYKVIAWFATNDDKLKSFGQKFIKSIKPANSQLIIKNKKEREHLSTIGWILFCCGPIISVFGAIFMIIAAFRKRIWWGLGIILIPFLWPIFLIIYWKTTSMAFWALLIGNILFFTGRILIIATVY